MWNPLKSYFEWRSRERAADRQVVLEAVQVLRSAFDAQAAQTEVFKGWLQAFQVTSSPEVREWDEEASVKRYTENHNNDEYNPLPPEFAGLNRIEAFERILESMDN